MAYMRIARLAGIVVLALSGALVTASPVFAATISVTTPSDEDGGPGDPAGAECSLREAIRSANTLTANGGCSAGTGTDTIDVPAGTYNVLAGELAIGRPNLVVTIQGAGSATTIIQALGAPCASPSRIFNVDVGGATVSNVTFNGLTIRNGKAVTGGGGVRISVPASTVTVADFRSCLVIARPAVRTAAQSTGPLARPAL